MNTTSITLPITSRQIAKVTGMKHKHVHSDIWHLIKKGTFDEYNYDIVDIRNNRGEYHEAFVLSGSAALYMLVKYSGEAQGLTTDTIEALLQGVR